MSKLRSSFLSSVRPFFAPDDDRRAAAQAERAKIVVTSSKKPDIKEEPEPEVKEEVEVKDDANTDKEDDKESDEKGEDDDKEGDEEDKDDDKEKEVEITPEIAKLNKTIERLQRRVGKTTGEKAAIAQQLATANASLAAKVEDGAGFDDTEVERRANIKAEQIATNNAFESAKAKLAKAALKADKDFTAKINEVAEEVGGIPGSMIGILEDLDNDNGGAVLAYLANNPDDYEEIIGFGLTKMSNRLNKLSDKILEDGKIKVRPKSKVPAPIEPIKGGVESPSILPSKPNKDKDSMEKFVKMRQQQEAERRKARYG